MRDACKQATDERGWQKQAAVSQPRIVIVGAGFGGLEAAKALRNAPVQVTVIAW